MSTNNSFLRQLPGVNTFLENNNQLIEEYGREQVADALRESLNQIRKELTIERNEELNGLIKPEKIVSCVKEKLKTQTFQGISRVINCTGVVLHTNLGRAVLADQAIEKLVEIAANYSNLELDLTTGRRGQRSNHLEKLLQKLTGAQGALVVNNNAAAVLLMLSSLAKNKQVLISRGQLVEVGGGFRIPEVLSFSGAKIVEVGTTNRTYLADYENNLTAETAAILYVHPSNFSLEGFTYQADLKDLSELAQRTGIPLLVDAGSGVLLKAGKEFLSSELLVQQLVEQGADLISFSGDKLLGGPQAGIVVGKKQYIDILKNDQLQRALRVDKLVLAALEETLKIYLQNDQVESQLPLWRALNLSEQELEERTAFFLRELEKRAGKQQFEAEIVSGYSLPGGGALPGVKLPTKLVKISVPGVSSQRLGKLLRLGRPPVIVRIEQQGAIIDLRTLLNRDEMIELVGCLLAVLKEIGG